MIGLFEEHSNSITSVRMSTKIFHFVTSWKANHILVLIYEGWAMSNEQKFEQEMHWEMESFFPCLWNSLLCFEVKTNLSPALGIRRVSVEHEKCNIKNRIQFEATDPNATATLDSSAENKRGFVKKGRSKYLQESSNKNKKPKCRNRFSL